MGVCPTVDLQPADSATGATGRTHTAADLRRLGGAHHRVATTVAKLEQDGWDVQWRGEFRTARHPVVRTIAQARRRLAHSAIPTE